MEGFKHIPVKLGDFSVIDQEFNSIRDRFNTEMKKMEDEMSKFRNELMSRESALINRSMLTSRYILLIILCFSQVYIS